MAAIARSSISTPPDERLAPKQREGARPDRPAQSASSPKSRDDDAELEARIQSYELAFRMQSAAPEAVDLSQRVGGDPAALRPGRPPDGRVRHPLPAGTAAGRARRPVRPALFGRRQRLGRPRRRRDEPRDHVRPDRQAGRRVCSRTSKRRGLFDSTLVIWGGEFGRMPMSESGKGRDHNPHGFLLLVGRRRASRAGPSTARPTPSAFAPRSIASTSTTSTRRSSTCSASTTPGSPSPTTAVTNA